MRVNLAPADGSSDLSTSSFFTPELVILILLIRLEVELPPGTVSLRTSSCGYIPVVAQKVRSDGSTTAAGGWRGSVHVA